MNKRRIKLFALLTGIVGLLILGACALWVQSQQHQYALNRQLIVALSKRDTQQALVLVNAGADPNTRSLPPRIPSVSLLINQLLHHTPPPVNHTNTALMIAAGMQWLAPREWHLPSITLDEDLPLLRAMLAHGADVNATAMGGCTALYGAVRVERWQSVEVLLQHGADPNTGTPSSGTQLMNAVANPTMKVTDTKVAHLLLTHGANPNAKDINGATALHYAIGSPIATSVIPELLAHGADPSLRTNSGQTALQEAQLLKRPDLIAVLKPAEAKK